MQVVRKFNSKLDSTMDVFERILEAFWQAVLYNTIENAHPKLFMSIRKDLGNKCLKKLENWR